ncbi:MAG: hypothetical protein M1829_000729 [Trizodia sp. TS-e1964]|nr:MAG: hypothetical protein M1829_000729 [Trizodia sp. TS-e1964]
MSIPRLWIIPGLPPSTQASRIACVRNPSTGSQRFRILTRFFRSPGAQLEPTSSSLLGALTPIIASAHLTPPRQCTVSPTDPSPLVPASNAHAPAPNHPVSSVRAGTPLVGLGFTKNNLDPIALEDHEYPAWLWECLGKSDGGKTDGREERGDLFCKTGLSFSHFLLEQIAYQLPTYTVANVYLLEAKSKKQRQAAAKQLRKAELANPASFEPKIPIEEQTVDLLFDEQGSTQATLAAQALRGDLTKAMRKKRRASIKEANFLKGMR